MCDPRRVRFAILTVLVAPAALTGCSVALVPAIEVTEFGVLRQRPVSLYTLENRNGLVAKITDYGATVTEMHLRDRDGAMADVALAFDTLEGYVDKSPYFGAMVGRVANRIANAYFTLDGRMYTLASNNGPHHLHGGARGFDKVVWDAEPVQTPSGPALRLRYVSRDGEEGYPGNLDVVVVYTLTNADELVVDIEATTDRPTPVNIVHHTYWNLAGHDSGDILSHELMLGASRYTPADDTLIPTGEIAPVAGTPYDFTSLKRIGADIDQIAGDPGGYDLNYVLDPGEGNDGMRFAARVRDPGSGRVMEIHTSEPGIQFYTGNFLDGLPGKGGAVYQKHAGFCLETQKFPDSIHRQGAPGWPSVVLAPGATYRHRMVHRFVTE